MNMGNGLSPRMRAAALLLLVGGFGFVAGILADRLVLSHFAFAAATGPEGRQPGQVAVLMGGDPAGPGPDSEGRRMVRLGLPQQSDELELTDEQQAEIERILAEDQAELRAVMEQFEPTMRAIIERSRERIYEVLTAEQIARWHESPRIMRLRTDEDGVQREFRER
jgi:hypothetical protein